MQEKQFVPGMVEENKRRDLVEYILDNYRNKKEALGNTKKYDTYDIMFFEYYYESYLSEDISLTEELGPIFNNNINSNRGNVKLSFKNFYRYCLSKVINGDNEFLKEISSGENKDLFLEIYAGKTIFSKAEEKITQKVLKPTKIKA